MDRAGQDPDTGKQPATVINGPQVLARNAAERVRQRPPTAGGDLAGDNTKAADPGHGSEDRPAVIGVLAEVLTPPAFLNGHC